MSKTLHLIILAVLLVSTAVFTIFVFIPKVRPYEVVNVKASLVQENEEEVVEEEYIPTLIELWSMEEDISKVMDAQVLNRELPPNWVSKQIYFKYTYIGQYNENTQTVLDDLLMDEYKWQKQLDENGNIVFGGIVLGKDNTYQLHTHNSYSRGNKFFLLGDLLDRYNHSNELVGTQIKFGDVTLEAVWAKDTKLLQENFFPFADLIISTCLQSNSDRRLVSGWDIVWEEEI